MKTAKACWRDCLFQPTFETRKSRFGGMEVSEATRLKALEDESPKFKHLLAEQILDNLTLKETLKIASDAQTQGEVP